MMLFHSTFVVQTLLGRSVSWNAQSRTDRGVTFAEAFRRQKWHLALGVIWGGLMLRLAPQFFWWLTPVLVGLIFGIPLTVWTSRISAGQRLRRWGLLLTPEEAAPPPELQALKAPPAQALPATAATLPAPQPAMIPPPARPAARQPLRKSG
jgi:membrane glycosyltransferase